MLRLTSLKKYNDHLNIPSAREELLKNSSSSTFAFHSKLIPILSKREFILRAKGWMYAEHDTNRNVWVLQVYTVPTMDKTAYIVSVTWETSIFLVTSITAITHAETEKADGTATVQQFKRATTAHIKPNSAKLSLRDPLFLRMKRLKLHLVSQVENVSI